MISKRTNAKKVVASANGSDEVNRLMAELDHPLKAELEAVRAIILDADKRITEGVKWKGPSFFFKDYFATINLRSREKVQIIFHQGAKVKDNSTEGVQIDDPFGLLTWLARERCLATLADLKDIKARRSALADIVRQWIKQM